MTPKIKSWFSDPKPEHIVQFYTSENALMSRLHDYIGAGLTKGDYCIVIATSDHISMLNSQLEKNGLNVHAAKQQGLYVTLDAAETLQSFSKDGIIDRKAFYASAGELMEQASRHGNAIRAYGEMVALLWKSGHRDAVMELEALWNTLAKKYHFSLYCAYPELHFVMHNDEMTEISACHALLA